MILAAPLTTVTRVFLDSAPVIYYVEQHPLFYPLLASTFQAIDTGTITAVTSPITLAECLIMPYRLGLTQLQQDFADLISQGDHTEFMPIEQAIASQASELRARYNLSLTDALQVASALAANCQALLTNDTGLRRVSELAILLVSDLTP